MDSTALALILTFGILLCLYIIYKVYERIEYNRKEFPINVESLGNKVVLITGCSSGFGKELAFKLRQLGFVVIATCRRKESIDSIYLSNNEYLSNGSYAYQLDVSKPLSVLKLKKQLINFLNDNRKNKFIFWGLVNNAGVSPCAPFELQSWEVQQQQIDIMFTGLINTTFQLLPLMYGRDINTKLNGTKYANGGRIVNISSVGAEFPLHQLITYQTTKAAVKYFTQLLRMGISPRFGIYCSSIQPGAFDTGMTKLERIEKEFNDLMEKVKKEENEKENKKENEAKNIDNDNEEENKDNDATNNKKNEETVIDLSEINDNKFKAYDIEGEKQILLKGLAEFESSKNRDLNVCVNDIVHALTAKSPERNYYPGVNFIQKRLIYLIREYRWFENVMAKPLTPKSYQQK